ncbi:AraC family transcriptional regulator [Panacagrimonas perspica]|nr:AraC family transcriptional regulator [Panacagrimonas perspica]THD03106.1 AraC family transcriptional regulator [Panacagrimonas perspica]
MSAEPVLHSLTISQVILNFAIDHGIDADTCLAGTGITRAMLQDPNQLATPEQEMRLIENLVLALPDQAAPGFELGLRYSVSTFGTWGFTLRTSRSLREAIERALRYIALSTAYCAFSSAVEGDRFIVCADPSEIPLPLRQFLLERDMGTALNLMRELQLTGRVVRHLEFTGRDGEAADRIRQLSGLPVCCAAPRNAVVMDLEVATTPLPTFDEHLVRVLEDQCRQLLERRQIAGIAGRVRQQLLRGLGQVCGLDEVARALHLSSRSLRRRLDEEGTSFRDLVEDTRRQLAEQMLGTTDMKLDELAVHLGYADTASFTRAFRRWHGVSPGQYRPQRSG